MSTTVLTPMPLHAGSLHLEEDSPRLTAARRLARIFGFATASLAFASVLLVFGLYGYMSWQFTHPPIAALHTDPMSAKGLAFDEISFQASDGGRPSDGWWIPAVGASARTVVLSHGFGANREEYWVPMYDIAEMLHMQNYNVLMFDYGYADPNRRTAATFGIGESKQLVGALEYARDRGSEELVVWGFSMGAGTALQAALQTSLIDGMILDSTFVTNADTIAYNLKRYGALSSRLTMDLLSLFTPVWAGVRLDQIPSDEIQSTAYSFPLLLIHGKLDDKAPSEISERIAKAQTNADSSLWLVQDAIHEMVFRTHPEEYVKRTTAFLETVDMDARASRASNMGMLESA
ncbi:alpha/beta hydrolase [Cohnella sp. JJ-181]|uniref:alpha/beta hydrolase n=1 Tax=Cohnella rhizoplanae TaxID=2974897 RepID=UPI0022FF5986|nr:alpha/beta hydrolase [Cohnella sp. JJ-181]CAI6064897.1 hypothetical protein COHCIP112018_02038 [Cohnella sp. JJ-181]